MWLIAEELRAPPSGRTVVREDSVAGCVGGLGRVAMVWFVVVDPEHPVVRASL